MTTPPEGPRQGESDAPTPDSESPWAPNSSWTPPAAAPPPAPPPPSAPVGTAPVVTVPGGTAPAWMPAAAPPPARKSRKGLLIGGIAAVVALVLIATGVTFAMGFGKHPDALRAIPSNALAVSSIDLLPSVPDQLAVQEFIQKFPSAPKGEWSDYKSAIWDLVTNGTDYQADYATEVAPWLGDSIAYGLLPGTSRTGPTAMTAIHVTDQAKARAFAEQHIKNARVEFFDAFMLVLAPDAVFTLDDLKSGSILNAPQYSADAKSLTGAWLATAWYGEDFIDEMTKAARASSPMDVSTLESHGIVGFRIADGNASAKAMVVSKEAAPKQESAFPTLASLPQGAVLSAGMAVSPDEVDALWDLMGARLQTVGTITRDDLVAALGSSIGLSVSGPGTEPSVALKVRTDNAATAQAVWTAWMMRFGQPDVTVSSDAGFVYVSTRGEVGDVQHPVAVLGDSPMFTQLTANATDSSSIVYLDPAPYVAELFPNDTDMQANVAVIGGIVIFGRYVDEHTTEVTMRLATK